MSRATEVIKKTAWRAAAARIAVALAISVPITLIGAQAADAAWALQNPPVPAGALGSDLADVSCTTGSSCVAIGGSELSGSVFVAFADAWNGSSWTLENIPNASNSNLSGVSCPFVGICIAVGDVLKNGKLVPLVEKSNGSVWTAKSLPAPSGAASSYLLSDYCVSGQKCTAVGIYRTAGGDQFTFAETLNGSTWTMHSTPDPSGATNNQLNKVYCTSPASCIAVGYYLSPSYTLLAESWNGTNWSIMTTPEPAGGTDGLFEGVACRNASACFAVGTYSSGTKLLGLSEFWNGASWTPQPTAPLTTAKAAGLAGVSCTTFGPCTAVGYERKNGHNLTLAEHWNGTSWKFQSTVIPPGAANSSMSAVSCRSNVDCTAVGFWVDGSGTDLVLAEQNT
ncbi:MAG TPA: hypothetical protein VKS82_20425 [Streptosporangiaceae bacterium]|nr:hypothetical protein [Streptosporangiaceae bacterium]